MLLSTEKRKAKGDAELLGLYVHTGRPEYLGDLYNRYLPMVYGLCLKYLKSSAAAQDATMQLFEVLLDKVGKFEIREFRTWLHAVARNHCLQLLRKTKREISTDFGTVVMESDDSAHLFDGEEDARRQAALERCMERLPAPQQVSVRLFFLEEKSYADVADTTGFQLKSVKSHIQNGKRNLKICLEKQGVTA